MTQSHPLDQKGSLVNYPLAELIVEIRQAQLSGSLRLGNKQQKTVIYFEKGEVVFAVSNAKQLRLFNILLQQNKIDKKVLAAHPTFANDLEFTASLQAKGEFSKNDVHSAFISQIDAIIVDALSWPDGEWHFSPLARLRDDVRYESNAHQVMIDFARCVPTGRLVDRFRNVQESFEVVGARADKHILQAHETHVLERFQGTPLNIAQLRAVTTLPENGLLQALYVLWLGGVVHRLDWNAAFTAAKIGEIHSAKISKVKNAEALPEIKAEPEVAPDQESQKQPQFKPIEITMSIGQYLEQIEKAETHYDTLGLANDADVSEIKQMYFGLAKRFHPDKFHRESEEIQKRIQSAFTELAHAYETLKSSEARDAYNFSMRKEMEARDKRRKDGRDGDAAADRKSESALESFEQAMISLKKEDYDQAVVLLGRAVHYSPENPQYHAYYGKALSAFEGQDHKAEAEFQTAVKLAPKDAKIRLMLVDFLVEIEMTKRAIGELNRYNDLVPGNKEILRKLEKIGT